MSENSDKGDRKTGIVWGHRIESWSSFKGEFDTRHEAIGHAARAGRLLDEDYEVRWRESLWERTDEPLVCDYCGFETWYTPIVKWTFTSDGAYCSEQCYARGER